MSDKQQKSSVDEYRKEMDELATETGWTLRRFAPVFIGTVVVLSLVGFGLNSVGMLGRTVVERTVFENSYQYKASVKSRIAIDNASLIEIEQKLKNPNLDADTRFNLEAQASAARVRIATAKGQQ